LRATDQFVDVCFVNSTKSCSLAASVSEFAAAYAAALLHGVIIAPGRPL